MEPVKDPFIFFHHDLDGVVSYLLFCWFKGRKLPYATLSAGKYMETIKNTLPLLENQKVYIIDFAMRDDLFEYIKPFKKNITIIDHHPESIDKEGIVGFDETSCSGLLYKHFFKNKILFTPEQKKLIVLSDDYDSYKLKLPESYDLNLLFWEYYRNNIDLFITDFYNGFNGFTKKQSFFLRSAKNLFKNQVNDVKLSKGKIEHINTVACLSTNSNTFLLDIIRTNHPEYDMILWINIKTKKVMLRAVNSDQKIFKCGTISEKYFAGGGHDNAAGGTLTDESANLFVDFTEL